MSKSSKCASTQIVPPALKCRKGDLAIRLDENFEGQIVEIVEYSGTAELPNGAIFYAWQVLHSTCDPGYDYFCEDKYLLPIRPDDLEEREDLVSEKEGDQ